MQGFYHSSVLRCRTSQGYFSACLVHLNVQPIMLPWGESVFASTAPSPPLAVCFSAFYCVSFSLWIQTSADTQAECCSVLGLSLTFSSSLFWRGVGQKSHNSLVWPRKSRLINCLWFLQRKKFIILRERGSIWGYFTPPTTKRLLAFSSVFLFLLLFTESRRWSENGFARVFLFLCTVIKITHKSLIFQKVIIWFFIYIC